MHVDVHRTRNARHTRLNLLGNLIVLEAVAAHDLDIDRRGQPKIQNLSHNVGRLEEKRHVRELFRQRLAELLDVFPGGAMLVFERHQDLAIPRTHCGAITKRQIHASYR